MYSVQVLRYWERGTLPRNFATGSGKEALCGRSSEVIRPQSHLVGRDSYINAHTSQKGIAGKREAAEMSFERCGSSTAGVVQGPCRSERRRIRKVSALVGEAETGGALDKSS
jgi:hypothetical protein